MALKAWLVPMCIAALVAGCGSSSDAGETGSTTVTGAALSNTQREEGIMEYLRMPQFDREVTDLITLVAVETDTAKVVFTAPGDREIPFSQYCDSVLDSATRSSIPAASSTWRSTPRPTIPTQAIRRLRAMSERGRRVA
jgi:hypothetical protein